MPELPEVETIRRTLDPLLVGRTFTEVGIRNGALRRPFTAADAARVQGRRVVATGRRGKFLSVDLDDDAAWIFHLGMSGRLLHVAQSQGWVPGKHDHIVVLLDDGARLVFNDPRRFGMAVVDERRPSPLFAHYGPDALDEQGFNAETLFAQRRRTKRSIKDVLMDQRVVAGLGNIYVAEALYHAGVRPRRSVGRLTRAECERVVACVRSVLADAVEHRGSTVSDFLDGIGRRGGYQWHHAVYDREGQPCPACGAAIRRVVIAQRSSFYCPQCQR